MENPCDKCLVQACCTKEAHCEELFKYEQNLWFRAIQNKAKEKLGDRKNGN